MGGLDLLTFRQVVKSAGFVPAVKNHIFEIYLTNSRKDVLKFLWRAPIQRMCQKNMHSLKQRPGYDPYQYQ